LWKRSADFQQCAPSTRRVRDNALAKIVGRNGAEPVAAITRAAIVKGRDKRADKPEAANEFVKLMRALFRWAVDAGVADQNPAREVAFLKPKNRDGFHTWTDDEIARFEARWDIGTRERLAMDVLLYTGLRASDAIRIGRQHVRGGEIYLPAMQKTGEPILCPIIAPLAVSLSAGPVGDLAFLVTTEGRPWSCPTSFGNWFRKACRAAGVPGSAHGLRKAGARIAAERGATEEQLKALYGWRSSKEASRYTRAANRQKMARAAADLRIPERNGIALCHAGVSTVATRGKK
jgi:integrase